MRQAPPELFRLLAETRRATSHLSKGAALQDRKPERFGHREGESATGTGARLGDILRGLHPAPPLLDVPAATLLACIVLGLVPARQDLTKPLSGSPVQSQHVMYAPLFNLSYPLRPPAKADRDAVIQALARKSLALWLLLLVL